MLLQDAIAKLKQMDYMLTLVKRLIIAKIGGPMFPIS